MDTGILDIVLQFNQKKILVLGDLIVDRFIHGESSRISPEAPVPVLDVQYENEQLGGAGNVAANLTALGATVYLCTVVGEDLFETQVKPLLAEHRIQANYLVRDDSRKTEIKTRLVAQQQTVVRFDVGDKNAISEASEGLLIDLLEEAYLTADAVLIADYEKGVITAHVIGALQQLHEKHPKFIAIDSKRLEAFKALQPTLVKPNYRQALELLKVNANAETNRVKQFMSIGNRLFNKTNAAIVALTLDADGALWLERNKEPLLMPAKSVTHACVCGAGDTYISTATLALIAGATKPQAARLATIAAGCVVEKEGTATCTRSEIIANANSEMKAIDAVSILSDLIDQLKTAGKRIVFTNGCFDILHCGHTYYLQQAKKLGDVLIVGINTDKSVRRLKGNSRPINTLKDRTEVLAAFSSVDYIISFGDGLAGDNPSELIKSLKPDIVVKGENYQQEDLPEAKVIQEIGAELILLPFTHGQSTSTIIRRIQGRSSTKNPAKMKAL
ncbi:D-glycero-beta-D-manno-heptose 1-phosphate adenylyltransferase [Olivibacter ginsenosidimutans]